MKRPAARTFLLAAICLVGASLSAWPATVVLTAIDAGITSPTGARRWLDVANQAYSVAYRDTYDYAAATVRVDYNASGASLRGTLTADNLKPFFAYQLKLFAAPDAAAMEDLGLVGRWWQEEWNGAEWGAGWNLNDKGNGSSPNPNDVAYYERRDIPDATSPTGRRYRYSSYLVLAYFITDGLGRAQVSFRTDSSYHVLWKTTQLARTAADGPPIVLTFDPDPAQNPAYDTNYPPNTVTVFGEWERLPVGGVFLRPGTYDVQMMLTEESFHGDGGAYAGNWAAAVGGAVHFTITGSRKGDFDRDDDVDYLDYLAFSDAYERTLGDAAYDPQGDFDDNGNIDFWDFMAFLGVYGSTLPDLGFANTSGAQFQLNGRPYRFVGGNNYYLMTRASYGGSCVAEVNEVLNDAQTLGLSVLRTWGFSHGLYDWNDPDYATWAHQPASVRGTPDEPARNSAPLLVEPWAYVDNGNGLVRVRPAVVNENTFRALDYVLAEARRRGIRLILPLINGGNLTTTNYEYGGRGLFVAWTRNPDYYSGTAAVPAASTDQFYTHPLTRQWYRDYIDLMLSRVNTYTGQRYSDDPAIFAWELGNELLVAPANHALMAAWVDEMAAYIHSRDGSHLVSVGVEGLPLGYEPNGTSGFENRVGISFHDAHVSSFVDFTTGHLWRDSWGFGDMAYWTAILQWQIAQSAALGKPYLFEEFNLRRSYGVARRDSWWAAYYSVIEAGSAAGGDLFWHLAHDSYPDYDDFTEYYPADASTWGVLAGHRSRVTTPE